MPEASSVLRTPTRTAGNILAGGGLGFLVVMGAPASLCMSLRDTLGDRCGVFYDWRPRLRLDDHEPGHVDGLGWLH